MMASGRTVWPGREGGPLFYFLGGEDVVVGIGEMAQYPAIPDQR